MKDKRGNCDYIDNVRARMIGSHVREIRAHSGM